MRHVPRLVVRVAGGLGNQLFMYAAARRLAAVSGADLVLDMRSGFRGDAYRRSNQLDEMVQHAVPASSWQSYSEPITGRPRELLDLARQRVGRGPRHWITDSPYHVDRRILDLRVRRRAYMRGYFQAEHYFHDIADELRDELTFRGSASDETLAVAREIDGSANAVGVHVRALYALPQVGAVSDLPPASTVEPTPAFIGPDFYRRAADLLVSRHGSGRFFLFSDHPAYAAELLDLPGDTVVVSHNSHARAAEDLWLLSRCRHHIICGSTFGWWGAWLGEHPAQTVVAPTRGYPNRDMMPDRWTHLDDG